MIPVSELQLLVKGLCGILATGKKKSRAAEEWKKIHNRINETVAIEAKASWKPGASKVISVFWVTEPGYSTVSAC